MRSTLILAWAALTAIWVGALTYDAVVHWPALSMDLSPRDPQVRAAYETAVMKHIGWHLVAAIMPPIVVAALGWPRLKRAKR